MRICNTIGIICVIGFLPVAAQQPVSIKPQRPIVCYVNTKNNPDHIPPSDHFRQMQQSGARTKTASIEVEYVNFPADNLARNAFQFAVDIWETELISPVTIRIKAQWGKLDAGVLGQANWGAAYANFDGAPNTNTFYPVALAEKIAGRELNGAADPDIVATFSSEISWYFGTDGNTPAGKMDMVTVVLHEIAHGLGFTDSYTVANSQGTVGLQNGPSSSPLVYDLFVENAAAQNLFSLFVSGTAAMRNQLTGNNLFFNSPLAVAELSGVRPRLYAPNPFSDGSSISHLDEATFNAPGDANRLMTPQISFAESVHQPGSILRNIFKDIGWVITKIQHTPLPDTERKDGAPYVVRAKIVSDNGYQSTKVILHYTKDGINYFHQPMIATSVADEFEAALPGMVTDGIYQYYITVVDVLNRIYSAPGRIQAQNKVPEQGRFVVHIGTDKEAPEITHTPIDFIKQGETELDIHALITDNIGVAGVSLEYKINQGTVQTMPMLNASGNEYDATLGIPSTLVIGDRIQYRIIALDNSSASNRGTDPAADFYSVTVTGILPTQDSYVNRLNLASSDFFGNSFSITTPAGFTNGAIHSKHPYDDAPLSTGEVNYIYQLQIPVKIDKDNPYIQFDEIVLVEPGENGSVFGDEDFYDYVIVEGSKDGGITWHPFIDGYDSRAEADWLTAYNSRSSGDNSTATGNSLLFKKRTINMLEKKKFVVGDEVLVRFRMYADQAAHGWGWAIDNLSIQGPVTSIEQPVTAEFKLFPNPVTDKLVLEVPVEAVNGSSRICILNLQGATLFDERVSASGSVIHHEINVKEYPAGLYLIKSDADGKVVTRKFLKE